GGAPGLQRAHAGAGAAGETAGRPDRRRPVKHGNSGSVEDDTQERWMTTNEDIEHYLERLSSEGVHSKEVGEGLWVLTTTPDAPEVVVHYNPPVVVLRVKVLTLGPGNRKAELYRHLLELNATD